MDKNTIEKLVNEAKEIANRNFCCSHSNFTVGAALVTKSGKVYKDNLPISVHKHIKRFIVNTEFIANRVAVNNCYYYWLL